MFFSHIKVSEICLILLFFVSLYMVEFGPYSSQAVAKYNGGFGTFDMKAYNPDIVKKVLSGMSTEGIKAEYRYYIFDFIFIIMMFIFQYLLSRRFLNNHFFYYAAIIIAAVRGIADAVENVLLIVTIHSFPAVNNSVIKVSSCITRIKLLCIALWNIVFFTGLFYGIYHKVIYKKK